MDPPLHQEGSCCCHDLTQQHKQGSQHQYWCDRLLGLPHLTHHLPGAALARRFPQALHLFFLTTASPRDQLLPSDFPGSGGEGTEPGSVTVAGRELFIPVPHQRVSAADATGALIAESGWVCGAGSTVDVPGFRQSSPRLSCACSKCGAALQEERKTCNVELYFGVLFWGGDSSLCSQTSTPFLSLCQHSA